MRRVLLWVAALAVVFFVLYALIRLLADKGLEWADQMAGVVSLGVTLAIGLAPVVRGWFRRPPVVSDISLADARDRLALSLSRELAAEERHRQINDPRPLPVRWEITSGPERTMPGVPVLVDRPEDMSGEYGQVLTVFERLPDRRLVVLGPAGAGKSVLVNKLVREILATRAAEDPVPMVLPAATWGSDGLRDWLARQLTVRLPELAVHVRTAGGGTVTLAGLLVDAGCVLPVLDGLDELDQTNRAKLITAVNAHGSDLPMVLTSRPAEYAQAVAEAGRAVARAQVVEVLPLRPAEVGAYLTEATAAAPAGRWRVVFERLAAEPDGPLAQVLTTPLMLWLARTIYQASDTDPGELTDRDRFHDEVALEHHLLDAFVPVVYSTTSPRGRFTCRPERAEKWLAFLAAYLNRQRTPDLAWWRLADTLRGLRFLGVTVRLTLAFAVAYAGLSWALSEPLGWREQFLGGPAGRLLWPAVDAFLDSVSPSVARAVEELARFATDLGRGYPGFWARLGVAVVISGVAGLVVLVVGFTDGPLNYRLQVPAVRLGAFALMAIRAVAVRAVFGAVLLAFLVAENGAAEITGFFALPSTWLLVAAFAAWGPATATLVFGRYADGSRAASPAHVLRQDRRADLLMSVSDKVLSTALCWLIAGWRIAVAVTLLHLAAVLVPVLLGGADIGANMIASRAYTDTRCWLALAGRLPWRTMTFLVDAHERGVLRQAGAVYQFRHIRLQERLADRHPPFWKRVITEFGTRHGERAEAALRWFLDCRAIGVDWWDGLVRERWPISAASLRRAASRRGEQHSFYQEVIVPWLEQFRSDFGRTPPAGSATPSAPPRRRP